MNAEVFHIDTELFTESVDNVAAPPLLVPAAP